MNKSWGVCIFRGLKFLGVVGVDLDCLLFMYVELKGVLCAKNLYWVLFRVFVMLKI